MTLRSPSMKNSPYLDRPIRPLALVLLQRALRLRRERERLKRIAAVPGA